jgi:hypothetical protein
MPQGRRAGRWGGNVLTLMTGRVQELEPMTVPMMITTKTINRMYSHIEKLARLPNVNYVLFNYRNMQNIMAKY